MGRYTDVLLYMHYQHYRIDTYLHYQHYRVDTYVYLPDRQNFISS